MVTDLACPGVLHAVRARDGMLARVRIPGGLVTLPQLHALADATQRFGDGAIDVTVRASVQLRGLSENDIPALGALLAHAGLLPSALHERVRNIVANPFAGCDPDELIDVRAFVRELDGRLIADETLARLPAKWCFSIDGGGYGFDDGGADLALRAIRDGSGKNAAGVVWHLSVAEQPTRIVVSSANVVEVLLAAAHAALAYAYGVGAAEQPWRIASLAGAREAVIAALAEHVRSSMSQPLPLRVSTAPFGVLPAQRDTHVNVVPSVPLGRLHAAQVRTLASLANDIDAEVRFTPWRGVALVGVARNALDTARVALRSAALAFDEEDGYVDIAACAGIEGCSAALADVRADARTMAERRASRVVPNAWPRRVHFSGCAKRCGMRRGADVEIVATERGYDVRFL